MPKIPGVNHLGAVKALEKAGFRILRQGKHIVMSDSVRILTIPRICSRFPTDSNVEIALGYYLATTPTPP